MDNMQMKCNGLHSGTKFQTFYHKNYAHNSTVQEWHEHPETGELVVMNCWTVSDGQDDIDHEFEVVKVLPPVGCQLAKLNLNLNQPIYA